MSRIKNSIFFEEEMRNRDFELENYVNELEISYEEIRGSTEDDKPSGGPLES